MSGCSGNRRRGGKAGEAGVLGQPQETIPLDGLLLPSYDAARIAGAVEDTPQANHELPAGEQVTRNSKPMDGGFARRGQGRAIPAIRS
jgi:hypothetical protein